MLEEADEHYTSVYFQVILQNKFFFGSLYYINEIITFGISITVNPS